MSGYHAHNKLTKARLADLIKVARGERVEIQRNRIRWFLTQGYLERYSARLEKPVHRLTPKGWEATGLQPTHATAPSSTTGYRSDAVKERGRD
jgi:hypothetical protein